MKLNRIGIQGDLKLQQEEKYAVHYTQEVFM